MVATVPTAPHAHDVFISYSRKDRAFAERLHKALREYRPPRDLAVPQRYLDVFLDKEDFTGVVYHGAVATHLRASAKLVLLCSPYARGSRFVDDEVRRFAEVNGAANIIPVLVSGIPNNETSRTNEDQMAFPAALCELMEMPLAVDCRGLNPATDKVHTGVFQGAWYTILSNIYGMSRAQLEQREKKREARRRRIVSGIVGGIVAVLLVALMFSLTFWRQAVNQRTIAVARQLAAQAELTRTSAPDAIERTVLLATESLKRAPSLEADLVIRPTMALLARPIAAISYGEQLAGVAFTRELQHVAIAAESTVSIWDLPRVSKLREWQAANPVRTLAFSPDARYLITGSNAELAGAGHHPAAQLWDMATGRELAHVPHSDPVKYATFSADGRYFASVAGTAVVVSEVPTGRQISRLQHRHPVFAIAFSPREPLLVSATDHRTLHWWNPGTDARRGRSVTARSRRPSHSRKMEGTSPPRGIPQPACGRRGVAEKSHARPTTVSPRSPSIPPASCWQPRPQMTSSCRGPTRAPSWPACHSVSKSARLPFHLMVNSWPPPAAMARHASGRSTARR